VLLFVCVFVCGYACLQVHVYHTRSARTPKERDSGVVEREIEGLKRERQRGWLHCTATAAGAKWSAWTDGWMEGCIHVHTQGASIFAYMYACCVLICILYVHMHINTNRALWNLAATQRIPETTAPRACHPRKTNCSSRAPCTHQSPAFALHQRPSRPRPASAVIDNVCHANWALGKAGP
jgi:hypothetical protein